MNPENTRSKAEHKLQESLISGTNCRNFHDHVDLIYGVNPLTSPTVPNESFPKQGMQLFRTLFAAGDKVCAGGSIWSRDQVDAWKWSIGSGKTEKGAYFKVNRLISDTPSGRKGGWSDKDCDTQLMMIEIDSGPKEDQLLLWSAAISLGFPVVSLVDSGGKSYHAIVRMNCPTVASYKKTGAAVLELFAPFIPDPTSVNASRFTRLPGVMRGVGDSARPQSLIYLNPEAPVWDGSGAFAGEMATFALLAEPVPEWLREASVRRAKERTKIAEGGKDEEKEQWLARLRATSIRAGADLGQLADDMGWTIDRLAGTDVLEEKIFIKCPWHLEHTGAGDCDGPTDAYLYHRKSNFALPWGFHCSHSSCNGVYGSLDIVEKMREEEPAALDAVVMPFDSDLSDFTGEGPDEAPDSELTTTVADEEADDAGGLNDIDNANTFVRRFKNKVFYLHDEKTWLLWDGKRWRRDELNHIHNMAEDVAAIRIRAAKDDLEKARAKNAGSVKSITSLLIKASCRVGVATKSSEFDTDLWTLGTPSGVIDLRTGLLRKARPADRVTKSVATTFDPSATCPAFMQCLSEFHPGRPEISAFLKRYFGYCLTGDVMEQKMVIFFGHGRNGKSTLVNAVKTIMGEYATLAGRSLLTGTPKADNDAASPGVMKMKGFRFGVASETEFGVALNESMVKMFAGDDGVTGRALNKEAEDFMPQVKLILSSNYKPRIKGTDPGIWRRIVLVPFEEDFEGRENPALKMILQSEYPGILRWMVEGCLEYQEKGLDIPECILKETRQFREGEDYLGLFINDNLVLEKKEGCLPVPKGLVYDLYRRWALSNGVSHPVQSQSLSKALIERGAKDGRNNKERFWSNLTILESADLG